MERGVIQLVDQIIYKIGASDPEDIQFPERIKNLFKELSEKKEMIRPFLSPNASTVMDQKLKKEILSFILKNRIDLLPMEKHSAISTPYVLAELTVSALIGLIKTWIFDHPHWKAENLSQIYQQFVTSGIEPFITK